MHTDLDTAENLLVAGINSPGLEVHYWHRKGSHEYALQLPEKRVSLIFFLAGGRILSGSDPRQPSCTGGSGQTCIFFNASSCTWRSELAMSYLQVSFETTLLKQYLQQAERRCNAASLPRALWFIDDPNLFRLGQVLADLARVDSLCDSCDRMAWAHLLASYIVHHLDSRLQSDPFPELRLISDATRFIDRHLHEPLTVAQITRQLSLPRHQLTHALKKNTGRSPYQFILNRRLLRARELLVTSRETIADIAYEVGFSSQSHMTSTFQRLLGTTPQHYRDELSDAHDESLQALGSDTFRPVESEFLKSFRT